MNSPTGVLSNKDDSMEHKAKPKQSTQPSTTDDKPQESWLEKIKNNSKALAKTRVALKTLVLILASSILILSATLTKLNRIIKLLVSLKLLTSLISLSVYCVMSAPEILGYSEKSKTIQKELDDCTNKNDELEKQISKTQAEIAKLEEEITKLGNKEDNSSEYLQKEIVAYLQEEIDNLERRIQQENKRLEKEANSSVKTVKKGLSDLEDLKQYKVSELAKIRKDLNSISNEQLEAFRFIIITQKEKPKKELTKKLEKLTKELEKSKNQIAILTAKQIRGKLGFGSLSVDLVFSIGSMSISLVVFFFKETRFLALLAIGFSLASALADFVSSVVGKFQHGRLVSLEDDPYEKLNSEFNSDLKTFVATGAFAILFATFVEAVFVLQDLDTPKIGTICIFALANILILGFDVVTKLPALTLEDVNAVQEFSAVQSPDLGG